MCWSNHYGADGWYYDSYRRTERRRTGPVTTPSDLRVSNTERYRVIDQLRHHTGEGRLTLEEFEARVEEALAARTGAELRSVLRELPALGRDSNRSDVRLGSAPWLRPAIAMASVLAVVWLVVGYLLLWPVLVVAFVWLHGRRASASFRRNEQPFSRELQRDNATTLT